MKPSIDTEFAAFIGIDWPTANTTYVYSKPAPESVNAASLRIDRPR